MIKIYTITMTTGTDRKHFKTCKICDHVKLFALNRKLDCVVRTGYWCTVCIYPHTSCCVWSSKAWCMDRLCCCLCSHQPDRFPQVFSSAFSLICCSQSSVAVFHVADRVHVPASVEPINSPLARTMIFANSVDCSQIMNGKRCKNFKHCNVNVRW